MEPLIPIERRFIFSKYYLREERIYTLDFYSSWGTECLRARLQGGRPRLYKALIRVHWKKFLFAALCHMFNEWIVRYNKHKHTHQIFQISNFVLARLCVSRPLYLCHLSFVDDI
jgi:hypothetical protein